MIFQASFLKEIKNNFLDETFINGVEDDDLYFRIFSLYKPKIGWINFQIKGMIRGSLEKDEVINFKRDMVNRIYFNYKWRYYLNKLRPQDLSSKLISNS
ncbi:hypothetical protein CM19_01125 [Candidatus Acidianus copahuensis]|uniref:Uncharacterized protein n=1 Tax=Candidatus Acidianus copahuensis TaxID=1160895 RepID=A0A031LUH2_9CREN|nr:hypothetical protein [Candidatus Acidianus copahuensis]EZQ11420.1 hypothetical protein CM19_01125 [Candidatus Acidianus copahuensis]